VFDDTFSTLMNGCSGRFISLSMKSWRGIRDLGAVLDYEEPLPIQHLIKRSSAQDHQRSVAMRRREETRTLRRPSSHAPRAR
jgi:hypothetical protein